MEIFNWKSPAKVRKVTVEREIQPELFDALHYLSVPSNTHWKAEDVTLRHEMNQIVIELRHNTTGNVRMTIELIAWEICAMIHCMWPGPDDVLGLEMKNKLIESVGWPVYNLYKELSKKHSGWVWNPKCKWIKKDENYDPKVPQ